MGTLTTLLHMSVAFVTASGCRHASPSPSAPCLNVPATAETLLSVNPSVEAPVKTSLAAPESVTEGRIHTTETDPTKIHTTKAPIVEQRRTELSVIVEDYQKLLRSPVRYSNGRLRVQIGPPLAPVMLAGSDQQAGHEMFRTGCGFVDVDGNVVVPPVFSDCNNYSEGYAAVAPKRKRAGEPRRWGVIDREGNVTLAPRFDWLSRFSEGLIGFRSGKGHGYLAPDGAVRIEPRFAQVGAFSRGFAVVLDQHSIKRVIDKEGRFVASADATKLSLSSNFPPPQAEAASFPYRDYAVLPFFDKPRMSYPIALPCSEGLCAVDSVLDDGRCEYVDTEGELQFAVPCDWPQPVSDGRIVAMFGGGKHWAVFDTTGRLVFDRLPDYPNATRDEPGLEPLFP